MADNHNQLLKDLIETISKDNITGETIKEIEKSNLWKELLEFMKQEGGSSLLGHYPIFQSDFKNDTLFKFINATADIDSNESPAGSFNFKAILDNLRNKVNPDGSANTNGNNPWNESLTNSLTYLLRYIDPEYVRDYENKHQISYKPDKDKETNLPEEVNNTNGSIPVKGGSLNGGFRITDVKNANAGNSFTNDGERPWVIPNYNVDGDTYDKVRGIDKILQVLTSHKEMQFTHTQNQTNSEKNNQIDNPTSGVSKYIRLLMPKYLRRVEVEDLNRNFWVIGQVLAAISAYLFDEDSPVTQMFKRILSELIQLWENILYLWAAVMLVSQKPYYTKVHTEVVYIPNDSYRDYWKYDNFQATRTTDLKTIWTNRLQYLKDSYPECHLCILPVVRGGNYRHNYYSTETWPGVILYNRNTEEVQYRAFTSNNEFTITPELAKRMYCIHEAENEFRYYAPFSNVNTSLTEELQYRYTAALRVRPVNIGIVFNSEQNTFTFNSINLCLDDAIGQAITGVVKTIATVAFSASLAGTISYVGTIYSGTPISGGISSEAQEKRIEELKQGYYLGELISSSNTSKEYSYEITNKNLMLRPIIYQVGDINDSGWTAIKKDDIEVLKSITPADSQEITLITGKHQASLIKKYNDPEGYQPLNLTEDMYFYDRTNKKVNKVEAGKYGGIKNSQNCITTYDETNSALGYTKSGGLERVTNKGPQKEDIHYYSILGKPAASDTNTNPLANACMDTSSENFRYGSIYSNNKNLDLSEIKAKKKIYLQRCRFTSSQEVVSSGAILKIGNKTIVYKDYEAFGNNLPRWTEVQPKDFKTNKRFQNQPFDMCEQLGRLRTVSKTSDDYVASVGRLFTETTTTKFYYKTSDGHMKKDNWVIEQTKAYFAFGPTMGSLGTPAQYNIGSEKITYHKDYWYEDDYVRSDDTLAGKNVTYKVGYKEPTWNDDGKWMNYYTASLNKENDKITGISLTYKDIPDNYSSLYAPFGFYGWPLTASDIQSLANLQVGQGSQYDVYWSKDVSSSPNKPTFPSVSVQMSPDLKALLDNNTIKTNKDRIYIPNSGLKLYPGWTIRVITNYLYPDGTCIKCVKYRLDDDYSYYGCRADVKDNDITKWATKSGSGYISSPKNLTAEGYTLYKVSGDFTKTNSAGKKEVFLDFAKYPSNGVNK